MIKCYTLLLVSALLVSSMSAPAPNTDTGGLINSRLNPISKRNSVQPLIKNFSNFLEDLPLDQLKLLESANDISEFQGILGALIHDDNEGGENVFDMIDQLKDRYTMLHGIVRGLIAKTGKSYPLSGNVPSKPSKENKIPSQSNRQSSLKNEVKPKLDGAVEKMVERQLMAAMKFLPVKDLEKLQSMLAEGNDPSLILKALQPAFPKLTDELIKVAVKYPSELTAVIEQILFDYKLEDVTPATTTAQPSTTTAQPFLKKNWEYAAKAAGEKTEAEKKKTVNQADTSTKEGKAYIFTPSDARNGDDDLDNFLPDVEVDYYQDTTDENHDDEDQHRDEEWSLEKTVLVNSKKTKSQKFNEPMPQDTPEQSGGWFGAWHFLIIFLLIAALVGVGYICSHNKVKIRAYIAEVASKGRKARNYTYKQVSTT